MNKTVSVAARARAVALVIAGIALVLWSAGLAHAWKSHRPIRVAIVTGEDTHPGHLWKDTSAELKTILEAGKPAFDFEVTIEDDPNFIASNDIFKYDVMLFDFRNAKPLA